MREWGTLTDWKDDKGFGFIKREGGGRDIFLHISALQNPPRRPQIGDRVAFTVGAGKDGRPRAENAHLDVVVLIPANPLPYLAAALCLGATSFAMLRTGYPFPIIYIVMSGITYALYNHDKQQAQLGDYRVPEKTLHLLELFGGWCGAYIAQQRLRHKTIKESYQAIFWGIVCLHTAGWGYYVWTALHKG